MSRLNLKTKSARHWQVRLRRLTLALIVFGCLPLGHARKGSSSDDACLADTVCSGLYEEARRLSKSGDFATALAAYQGAYRRQGVPWLLINIGRTLHKLGRPAEALLQYRRYLTDEPNGPAERLQTVNDYIAQAEKAVSEKAAAPAGDKPNDANTAKPDNPASPTGGERGKDPSPPASSGNTQPEVEPPPGPAETALTPPPIGQGGRGETGQASPPTSGSTATASSPGSATGSPPGPVTDPRSVTAAEPRRPLPTYFWAGLGVGGGLLAVGAATGIAALVGASSINDTAYAGSAPSSLLDQQARVRGLAISTDVLLGVGAATVGVVTVVMLVGRKSRSAAAK